MMLLSVIIFLLYARKHNDQMTGGLQICLPVVFKLAYISDAPH